MERSLTVWYFKHIFIVLMLGIGFLEVGVSQSPALGGWRSHFPYNSAISIVEYDQKVYCASPLGLYSIDKNDHSIRTYTKANRLSDIGISKIAYNESHDYLLVAYKNGNIDLISGQKTSNIGAIKRKNIQGGKGINEIFFHKEKAYLACDFGIVALQLEEQEIKDTYFIGSKGGKITVWDIVQFENKLIAATEEGIKIASLQKNLSNFKVWEVQGKAENIYPDETEALTLFDNKVIAALQDTLFSYKDKNWKKEYYAPGWQLEGLSVTGGELFIGMTKRDSNGIANSRITRWDTSQSMEHIYNSKFKVPVEIAKIKDGELWIADEWKGCVQITEKGATYFKPSGPFSSSAFSITSQAGQVWVASGAVSKSWNIPANNQDGFYNFTGQDWYSYNQYNTKKLSDIKDIITVAISPDNETKYLGSYGDGLVKFSNGNITIIDKQNSTLQGATGASSLIFVAGLAFDQQKNLWVSNSITSTPVNVKTAAGNWYAYKIPALKAGQKVTEVVIDELGQKWFVLPRGGGVLVFDENGTFEDRSDDEYKVLGTTEGNGGLPSKEIYSIAKDKEGNIWVGTGEGIAVYYCPGQVMKDQGCDAQRILVEQGGYTNYLMESERVQDIAIDGGNRKWIATTNGAWLLSTDGKEEVHHFTKDNSPLLSNDIRSIGIEGKSGEIFFATSRGIVSFKSTATEGNDKHTDVYAYPNPVRPNYEGKIAIKGLVENAYVKITDVTGRLVYETQAIGGQAIWDGKNKQGQRVKTGVYLVFSTDEKGKETIATKLLFVN